MCTCGICGQPFPSHTALADHIFRDHANRMLTAIIAAAIVALAMLTPVKADSTEPPSVGEPPIDDLTPEMVMFDLPDDCAICRKIQPAA